MTLRLELVTNATIDLDDDAEQLYRALPDDQVDEWLSERLIDERGCQVQYYETEIKSERRL